MKRCYQTLDANTLFQVRRAVADNWFKNFVGHKYDRIRLKTKLKLECLDYEIELRKKKS